MKVPNEIKAGIVVVAAIAIGVLFFAKTVHFARVTYDLNTEFVYAGDLKPNAVVKLSGIEVGRLKDISFDYEDGTRVKCVMEIDSGARVRKDSIAYIGTAGFVGDAYIGITAGTDNDFLRPGETVASEDPIQMRQLMKKMDKIGDNLNGVLTDVRGLIKDNKGNIDSIFENLKDTSVNFNEFSEDVKRHPWKLLFKGE